MGIWTKTNKIDSDLVRWGKGKEELGKSSSNVVWLDGNGKRRKDLTKEEDGTHGHCRMSLANKKERVIKALQFWFGKVISWASN